MTDEPRWPPEGRLAAGRRRLRHKVDEAADAVRRAGTLAVGCGREQVLPDLAAASQSINRAAANLQG